MAARNRGKCYFCGRAVMTKENHAPHWVKFGDGTRQPCHKTCWRSLHDDAYMADHARIGEGHR